MGVDLGFAFHPLTHPRTPYFYLAPVAPATFVDELARSATIVFFGCAHSMPCHCFQASCPVCCEVEPCDLANGAHRARRSARGAAPASSAGCNCFLPSCERCNERSVVEDLCTVVVPGFPNGSTHMSNAPGGDAGTFKHQQRQFRTVSHCLTGKGFPLSSDQKEIVGFVYYELEKSWKTNRACCRQGQPGIPCRTDKIQHSAVWRIWLPG